MLGLGASLLKGGGIVLAYIKDSLKLFYPFTDNSPDFLLDGSTSFDGNDYINLGDDSSLDITSNISLSMWVKFDNGSATQFLMGRDDDSNRNFELGISSNKLFWNIYSGGSAKGGSGLGSALSDNIWYHISATYDGSNLKTYVNGSLNSTNSGTGAIDNDNVSFTIGARENGMDRHFDGKMANVGIWNRALSASEIESIRWRGAYSELKDTELTNLVSWYDLQGDVLDSAGSNNGTNNGATLNSNSYSGESPFKPRVRDLANPKMAVQLADGSTSFDGNDFINAGTLSDAFKNVANMSVSVWVYPTHSADADDDYHSIVNQWDHNTVTQSWGLWLKAPDGSTDAHIHWNDGTAVEDASATVPVNEWSHISVTKSGTTVKLYHNGSEVHSGTGSSTTGNHSEPLLIGVQSESSKVAFFNGKMANISLHTSALTQLQVQELMFTEKYQNLSADLKTNLVSFYDMGSSSNPHNDLQGSNNGTNNGATVNTGYTSSPHGVVDPLNFGEVYSGRAVNFDGSSDYIDLGDKSDFDMSSGDFTVGLYVKTSTNYSGAYGRILMYGEGGQEDDLSYSLFINTSNYLGFEIDDASSPTSAKNATSSSAYNDDKWHHLVGVREGTNIKLYIDGSLITTTAIGSYGSLDMAGEKLYIGANNDSGSGLGNYFTGKINNVKLFNTALTETQIQELYTNPEQILPTGVSASNLKLDLPMQEGSGSYVYDGSGNGNHGTIIGATWATPAQYGYQSSLVRSNTPMIFDGVNDDVSIPHSTPLNISGNITLSLWVNIDSNNSGAYVLVKETAYGFTISGQAIKFRIYDSSYGWRDTGTFNVTYGKWHHILATYDGSNQKLYIDGSLQSNISISFSASTSANALKVGSYQSSSSYVKMLANEVAIWNTALDADAVTALYNSGVPLLPTSDSGNYDNSSALQGYWRNDGNTTWTDRSTNSNNGTVSDTSVASIVIPEGTTSGRDNQGFLLSNTHQNSLRLYGNEYVEIQDSETLDLSPSSGFSVESWVYINSLDAYNPILSQWNTADNSVASWVLETVGSDLTFYIRDTSSGGSNKGAVSSSTATLNVWIHVVGVFEGDGISNGLKIYVNGTVGGTTQTITTSQKASFNIMIGEFINKNNTWDGLIDESRIYSKALSASEVLKNYNSGKSSHS